MTNVQFNRKPLEGAFTTFVDDLFAELPVLFKNEFNQVQRKSSVPVNVIEADNSYQLEIVAPGFDKEDFKVNLDQNLMTISGEKKIKVTDEKNKNIRIEYSFNSFKRSFTLNEKIDATNIEASYINGVLILNLPKKEEVKVSAKEIVIK